MFEVKQKYKHVRFKARLVAKWFTQKEGVDYTDTFAIVVKFTTVRIMLALVAHYNWELKHMEMGVTVVFLRGDLDKDTYMKSP